MYIPLIKIPDSLLTVLFLVEVGAILSAFIPGADFGVFKVPDLLRHVHHYDRKQKRKKINVFLSLLAFIITILLFSPLPFPYTCPALITAQSPPIKVKSSPSFVGNLVIETLDNNTPITVISFQLWWVKIQSSNPEQIGWVPRHQTTFDSDCPTASLLF